MYLLFARKFYFDLVEIWCKKDPVAPQIVVILAMVMFHL